ncbi:hypothetical protein Tco_0592549 [Tanacetum coccineum]
MVEPEKPLKKKDQILVDEEIAQRLQEELQAELEEEERLARQKEEEDNLNSWDNTQAMMEADYELAQRLQQMNQEVDPLNTRSKLFVEAHGQGRSTLQSIRASVDTKVLGKNILLLFDNTLKWVDSFVPMDSEQKINENVEAEVDDEAEMKKHMEIVPDDENIDREDLETLWKLVKAKHRNTRSEDAYERVLWGDLKVMFEPDVEIGINKTFHEQNDDELTEAEIKQMEADDQAIQTILLGLLQDIYAAVDSYETAQEIWLRVQQMMKGSDIGIQVKKDKLCWELY